MTSQIEMVQKIVSKHPQYLGVALRALARNVTSLVDYSFKDGNSLPPKSITFRICGQCNLNCKMCFYRNANILNKNQLVPFTLFKAVIDQVYQHKLFIGLTGGEPLLHPEILKCVHYAKEKGLPCSMATNGWYLSRYAAELATSGLDLLSISIDGPGEINDKIRGRSGINQRAYEGIREVLKFKKRPLVVINTCMQADNYEHIAEVVDEAIEVGVDGMNVQTLWTRRPESVTMHNQLFPGYAMGEEWFDASLLNIDFDVLWKVLEKARSKDIYVNLFPFSTIQQIRTWYQEPRNLLQNHRQLCPWMFANVFYDGTLRSCDDIVLGDLKINGFWEIWNGERARDFRKTLRRHKNFPICAGCCSMYRDFAM